MAENTGKTLPIKRGDLIREKKPQHTNGKPFVCPELYIKGYGDGGPFILMLNLGYIHIGLFEKVNATD